MLRGRASILSNPRLFCRGSGSFEQRFSVLWCGSADIVVIRSCATVLSEVDAALAPYREQHLVKHSAEFLRMLSPKTQTNLANAKGYFEEHLCAGDYYAENSRVQGVWIGAGAVLLGLDGHVMQEAFLSLCENRHPGSGKRLTQRHKTTRMDKLAGGETTNRRVFFDFTISPPKSVSIAALVADDSRIVAAHREAVAAAIAELEGFASARIRERGANRDRRTGNIVAALFEHRDIPSARPASAHALHCLQRHPRSGGGAMEGAAEPRHACGTEIHRERVLPRAGSGACAASPTPW